jgi:MFS family permease
MVPLLHFPTVGAVMDVLDYKSVLLDLAKFIFGCALFLLPILGTFGCGAYILRPLDRAARKRKQSVHFTIIDALALVTHLSIPLGFIGRISERDGRSGSGAGVLVGFGCFAAVLIWYGTVATAARAGITHPMKRLLMIGLIVPLSFVATIVFGPLLSMLLYNLFAPTYDHISPWLYLLEIGLAVIIIGCRRAVDWILREPEAATPVDETDEAFA